MGPKGSGRAGSRAPGRRRITPAPYIVEAALLPPLAQGPPLPLAGLRALGEEVAAPAAPCRPATRSTQRHGPRRCQAMASPDAQGEPQGPGLPLFPKQRHMVCAPGLNPSFASGSEMPRPRTEERGGEKRSEGQDCSGRCDMRADKAERLLGAGGRTRRGAKLRRGITAAGERRARRLVPMHWEACAAATPSRDGRS